MSQPGLEVEPRPQESTKTEASLALSWSGGKDSALALLALRAEFGRDPCALITTVTETYNRISMHGVRRELLALQAQELGLPLVLLRPAETTPGLRVKPRLRGLAHEIAFFLVLPLGAMGRLPRLSMSPGRRWQAFRAERSRPTREWL